MMRRITRYSNRKLYDPQQSRYVTLDALEKLIAEGEEISVADLAGNDLTSVTLIQILLERQRTSRGTLASPLLHQMIRRGAAWQDLAQHANELRDEIEALRKRVEELERRRGGPEESG